MRSPHPLLLVLVIALTSFVNFVLDPTIPHLVLTIILAYLIYLLFHNLYSEANAYQKQLRSLENALSLVSITIESTVDGVLIVDKQEKVTKHNRRFVEMWKIPPNVVNSRDQNQILKYTSDQLVDPEYFIKKIQETHDHPSIETLDVVQLKDNRVFEVYSLPQKLKDEAVGRVWNFHDVTIHKRQEEKLKENMELLKTKTRELEQTSKFMVDREIRMNELKHQIQKLEHEHLPPPAK